jgi:hypothetical protein
MLVSIRLEQCTFVSDEHSDLLLKGVVSSIRLEQCTFVSGENSSLLFKCVVTSLVS